MRTALIITYRVSLIVGIASLFYLLFMFGHTELTPLSHIWLVAILAAFSGFVAGILNWVGLPEDPNAKPGKHGKKKAAK